MSEAGEMESSFNPHEVEERHQPVKLNDGYSFCRECGQLAQWPCDAAQAVAVIRERDQRVQELGDALENALAVLDAIESEKGLTSAALTIRDRLSALLFRASVSTTSREET